MQQENTPSSLALNQKVQKVLFVCLGNICRSPTAHAVMRHKIKYYGMNLEIDSAGTHASHKGESPDPRSVREGEAAGYKFNGLYSRPVKDDDFSHYDLILAMDNDNLAALKKMCPAAFLNKIQLFLTYHPDYPSVKEVPDPYYGGSRGFALVLSLIEKGCEGLIDAINAREKGK